jgi:hypothetical protein
MKKGDSQRIGTNKWEKKKGKQCQIGKQAKK